MPARHDQVPSAAMGAEAVWLTPAAIVLNRTWTEPGFVPATSKTVVGITLPVQAPLGPTKHTVESPPVTVYCQSIVPVGNVEMRIEVSALALVAA
jgi:hypothetical protein